MKKTVLVFGLISGTIISTFMAITMALGAKENNFDNGMIWGYTAMLVSFSFIFVGVKNYRDNYQKGLISFGQAFKTGLLIALIASTMYVVVWMIEYNFYLPDFMDKYSAHLIQQAKESGTSAAELNSQLSQIQQSKELYKNPLFFILITYMEIFPVGLVVSLISAAILKRKPNAVGESN